MRKINGLTQKAHPFQMIAYTSFFSLFATYFLITFPLSTLPARVVGAILQIITALAVFISGYIVTITDTSDTFLLETLKARAEGNFMVIQKSEYLCSFDKAYVHESSKHCKRCGRCTEGFDHHCKWVNNDIGKKNYKAFVAMIVSVLFFLIVFLVFGAIVTAHYARDQDFVQHEVYMYRSGTKDGLTGMIILWVFMFFAGVMLILDANLVFFHIFLIRKGLTTFQYLTLVEERKDNKKEMEIARRAMGDQKKTWLDFVLCLGKKKKKRASKSSFQLQDLEKKKITKDTVQNEAPNQEQEQRHSIKSDETKHVCGTDPELDHEHDHDPHAHTRIITNMETDTNRRHMEFLRTEEHMLLSNKNETRIEIRSALSGGDDILPSSESPTNVGQRVGIYELKYEVHQVKKNSSADREAQNTSPTDKSGKLFLNLGAMDQDEVRKLSSANQSSHHNHPNMYSFEKTQSQNEVNNSAEGEHNEHYGTTGKSKFALENLVSKNKVQVG